MFTNFEVTIPANTTEAEPKLQTLQISRGVVHQLEVNFPAGCRGYVYLALYHHDKLVWPSNLKAAFRGEGYTIPIKEYFKVSEPPYTLVAYGWSPGSTYDHTITVRVGVLKEIDLEPLVKLPAMFAKFFKLLGVKA